MGTLELSRSEAVLPVVVLVDLVFAVVFDAGAETDDGDDTDVTPADFDFLTVFLAFGVGVPPFVEDEALELTFLTLDGLGFLLSCGSRDTLVGFLNLGLDVVSEDPVDVNFCFELILEVGTE